MMQGSQNSTQDPKTRRRCSECRETQTMQSGDKNAARDGSSDCPFPIDSCGVHCAASSPPPTLCLVRALQFESLPLGLDTDMWRPQIFGRRIEFSSGGVLK
eukprot:8301329-Pyramimonas_sp.AAC.1